MAHLKFDVFIFFVREFLVLTMTTAAMYSMPINSLDVWERVTLNHRPPPHVSSSGGDSVYCLSAIPSVSFRSNSFPIRRPIPMLVQKMSKPGHGDSDSSGISTSTSLPDARITWHATVTAQIGKWTHVKTKWTYTESLRWVQTHSGNP